MIWSASSVTMHALTPNNPYGFNEVSMVNALQNVILKKCLFAKGFKDKNY